MRFMLLKATCLALMIHGKLFMQLERDFVTDLLPFLFALSPYFSHIMHPLSVFYSPKVAFLLEHICCFRTDEKNLLSMVLVYLCSS